MTIKVLNEFLPNAEIQRLGAVKVGDTLEITQDEGVLNVDPTFVVSAYYSNIITEIAQDIKLELNDGTLTLKAGSKIYVPNGAGKFDVITVTKDVSRSTFGTDTGADRYIIPIYSNGTITGMSWGGVQNVFSGTTKPTVGFTYIFYNTSTNYIKGYSGDSVISECGFPIGKMTLSSGQVTSIDQVFNGAGYIGHHAFILPGLKGMAPDGLSDKGYVKNVNIEVNKVLAYDLTSGSVTDFNNSFLFLNPLLEVACQQYITLDRAKELVRTTGLIQYAYQENKGYAWNGTTYVNPVNLPVVECSLKNSAVTYFRILQPLRMATVSDIKESTDSFLFDYKWADHNPNKLSWLRADTFNWQDGATYKSAYKHLVEDFNGTTSATETIGSNTITYYLATDKHKIVLPDQESIVQAIYNETGIAWYYILDTANTRFKLPRTKFGFVGIRDGVGNYIPESVPNITSNGTFGVEGVTIGKHGAFVCAKSDNGSVGNTGTLGDVLSFDASRSSSAYQDNAPVQQRATQMYLYCYVGRANQDALEKSEIDIVALTNSSINQITSTKNTSLTEINTATEEGINRLNTDSNALNRTQITNCITEIPQDIKLELNNGTLTLKAGSKVYVPNGAGVFNTATTTNNIVWSETYQTSGKCLLFYVNNVLSIALNTACYSGTNPSSITGNYYNTSANTIDYYNNGTGLGQRRSFPICEVTLTNGVITSIDQVFNGFGYIGSTVFALPGVKCLIPNGRNADGSLKNFETKISTVKVSANTGSGRDIFVIDTLTNFNRVPSSAYKFDIDNNKWVLADRSGDRFHCVCGTTTGDITSFNPKAPFRAVDYNDAVLNYGNQDIGGNKNFTGTLKAPTPSSATDNSTNAATTGWFRNALTSLCPTIRMTKKEDIASNGLPYTATANGIIRVKIGATYSWQLMINGTIVQEQERNSSDSCVTTWILIPVKNGDVLTATGNAYHFDGGALYYPY